MSYRPVGILPSLRISLEDGETGGGPGPGDAAATPRLQSRGGGAVVVGGDGRSVNRINYLESRLAYQERTTNNLVDRAFKVREDIIESLSINQLSWQEEKQRRILLQEHIRVITDIVRKLGQDIQVLEERLRDREGYTAGTNDVIKNLELSHVGGLTDLRGRVVRCDSSISRLSADVSAATDLIKTLGHQQQDEAARNVERIHTLDNKIREVNAAVERALTQHVVKLQHVETDSTHQLSGLDAKTRSMAENLKTTLQTYRQLEQTDRDHLEAKLLHHIDRMMIQRDERLDRLQHKITECLTNVNTVVKQIEDDRLKLEEKNNALITSLEERWKVQLELLEKKQRDEMDKMKREYRVGLTTTHDSIQETKNVLEAKRRLLEEHLSKELGHMRKMVIVT